jgi:hypothetical protein
MRVDAVVEAQLALADMWQTSTRQGCCRVVATGMHHFADVVELGVCMLDLLYGDVHGRDVQTCLGTSYTGTTEAVDAALAEWQHLHQPALRTPDAFQARCEHVE